MRVKRTFCSFSIDNIDRTKWQMLDWANQFNICCFLDSHQYDLPHREVECLVGVGSVCEVMASAGNAFEKLNVFTQANSGDWCFGHLAYDLKNETEQLHSSHPDKIAFPDLFFFVPEVVLQLENDQLWIGAFAHHQAIADAILQIEVGDCVAPQDKVVIQSRYTKQAYLQTIHDIRQHIIRGDCYEMNFCQEFYCEGVKLDPVSVYRLLCEESPNPFAAFYRLGHRYLFCASPERYLKKSGFVLLSQPIKGTARRNLADVTEDQQLRERLRLNPKDRAENVMIVDLVRNDLAKICREGSVQVQELQQVYSFPQVHQMISTVTGLLDESVSIAGALEACFPMGSMTGAPKKRVMELIEQYERTRRGLFSGAVGYINPENNFDFNVVIRSILYHSTDQYLSFPVGSAITYLSEPEKEYEECLLKVSAIQKILGARAQK